LQSGRQIELYLDWQKIEGVRSVKLDVDTEGVTEITVKFIAVDVEADIEDESAS
jgi:uncharacterized linocin/CFP29 family protein